MISSKRYGYRVQLNHLKSGDISYYINYKTNKKTIQQKVGRKSEGITEKKCFELRAQILSELRHGVDLSQKSIKYLTLNKLSEAYFSNSEVHNRSNKKYKQMYQKHIKSNIGEVVIAKLEDGYIYKLQASKLKEGLSKSTINLIIKLIKRVIGFGIKRGIINYTPFKDIKLFKLDNSRLRYLNNSEIKSLLKSTKDDILLYLFVLIALKSGARANSILSIKKKDINIQNRSITLKDFKRDSTYVGYLDEDSFNLLLEHTRSFSFDDYVLSYDGRAYQYQKLYRKLTKIFERFNKNLSKNDRANRVVIHTLRHTFASHLAIKGVSIQRIQKLMNHKDIKQSMKYAKLSPDSGREEVQKLYKEVENDK